MKFMSNAGVFIVIAAFAACAAGTVNMPEETSLVVQDSAVDEQPGASLRLRLRRCNMRLCEIGGCQTRDVCDGQGNCYRERYCRMKREDFGTLDAAIGVYEDEISNQIGSLRARRSSSDDSAEEDARAAEELRLRLRRCVLVVGRDAQGNQAEQIVCRMKREDYDILDAAMGLYEEAAPVGDNGESADDEQPDASSPLRQRRTVYTQGCDSQGNCGIQIVGRMKREDSEMGVNEDDESSPLRQRRCVWTHGCDSRGNCGLQKVCRMKREDSEMGVNEYAAPPSGNCLWQCVCTTGNGGNEINHAVGVNGSRDRRGVSMTGDSSGGQSLTTTVTSGQCSTFSQGRQGATCQSVQTCY